MHMADALISTGVASTMIVASTTVGAYSVKNQKKDIETNKIPLMGVMGAFVFASQMINFTIPGTGASGHLGGGILLAILLGPYAGFLTMASILLIQALFFADGGLLSFGCNVFNLGFYSCFIGYNFIYKPIIKRGFNKKNLTLGIMTSSIISLQLGSLSVVIQTLLSGKTELSFSAFLLTMQPIHLAIGIVEGLVITAVILFIYNARPELINNESISDSKFSMKKTLALLSILVLIIGGGLSLAASSNPDGLEWSIFKSSGDTELKVSGSAYEKSEELQNKTAFLPDYNFKSLENKEVNESLGTSFSGIIGSAITFGFLILVGVLIKLFKGNKSKT